MRPHHAIILTLLFVLALPSVALANPNAGVAWMGHAMMLLFGNALIALVEAVILWRWCRTRPLSTFGLLFVANYVSAWVGFFALGGLSMLIGVSPDRPIGSMLMTFSLVTLASIPLAMLIEAPFFWLCLRLRRVTERVPRGSLRASIRPNLWINILTGLAMAGYVASISNLSMATRLAEWPDARFAFAHEEHEHAWVYFVDDEGLVRRCRLSGNEAATVEDDPVAPDHALAAESLEDGTVRVILRETGYDAAPDAIRVIAEGYASTAETIKAYQSIFAPTAEYGFDTPISGTVRVGTAIPINEELHVCGLTIAGRDYITAIDLRGYLAHLARGTSPVVVYEPSDSSPTLPPTDATPNDPLLRPDP